MPDMNGIELLGRLKSDAHLREIRVIMISGLKDDDAVIRCIEAGAEDYLQKPIDPILLRARITACLERSRWRERESDISPKSSSKKTGPMRCFMPFFQGR